MRPLLPKPQLLPRPKVPYRTQRRSGVYELQELPSPGPNPAIARRSLAGGDCPQMVNNFNHRTRSSGRIVEPCGEPFNSAEFGQCNVENQAVVQCSIPVGEAGRRFLRKRLAGAIIGLTTGPGPRRPNAARALCEESYMTEAIDAGAALRPVN